MSSMPTPCDAALPSMAAGGSLSSVELAWQSIGFKACLIGCGAASRKRQRLPQRRDFGHWGLTA